MKRFNMLNAVLLITQRTPTDPDGPRRTPTDPNGPQRTPTDPNGHGTTFFIAYLHELDKMET